MARYNVAVWFVVEAESPEDACEIVSQDVEDAFWFIEPKIEEWSVSDDEDVEELED